MLKRILEVIAGIALVICLIVNTGDDSRSSQLLIWQIVSVKMLQGIVWVALFLLASRLVFGKYKDYSGYFYNLFVKMFGDPKKTKEH